MSNEGLAFVATVLIPPGFILAGSNDFSESIVFDESNLVTNIIMETLNCDEERICTTTSNLAILTGTLNYNVTIGDLRPAEPSDSVANSATTQFAEGGFLQITRTLGYSFNEDPVSTNYVLDYKKGEEFIVNINGESVYRLRDNNAFMSILNNPNRSKTINIPYVIRICSQTVRNDERWNM